MCPEYLEEVYGAMAAFCEMWVLRTIHTGTIVSDFSHLARNSSILFFCTSKLISLLFSEFRPSLLGSFSTTLSSTIIWVHPKYIHSFCIISPLLLLPVYRLCSCLFQLHNHLLNHPASSYTFGLY